MEHSRKSSVQIPSLTTSVLGVRSSQVSLPDLVATTGIAKGSPLS